MAAEFEIYKYTGKECEFGTPVSSIGIKRIDAAVPAVYGIPIVPADDVTDVNTYAIYRPDVASDDGYSFESIFKFILKTPPSNQLSHMRIYPATERPDDPHIPILKIGCSRSFSRPTNTMSLVATHDIWDYTEESPFLVTVGSNYGQSVDEQVAVINYNITQHDIGFGNLMYLNDERQLSVPIVMGSGPYTFVDKTSDGMTFQIYDVNTSLPITDSAIVVSTNGAGERVVTINPTNALLTSYPNGFLYGDIADVNLGGTIGWLDLTSDPIETEVYDVTVENLPNGSKAFFLNGVRNPVLNFRENRIYQFNNPYGATDPIRFLTDAALTQANVEDKIIIKGITVTDGGTANEVVVVNPSDIKTAGQLVRGYQSTFHSCYGNIVNNTNTALIGNYNINTVGAGVSNPLAAGETDFIYLQLKVTGNSTVGQTIPELKIEYDEN
jgi:hypothetical protein